jgi:hypothetical protein
MGSKALIGVNHVTERMLPPHLRRRPKTVKNTTIIETKIDTSQYDTFTAGETISKGNAVHIAADGLAYKGDNAASRPAVGFAAFDAEQNATVYVQSSRKLTVATLILAVGATVFLSSGSTNISTSIPTPDTNRIIQRLGTAVAADTIKINVEESRTIV